MTDEKFQDIEDRRRQLSEEEREAQAAYDREAVSSAPVDRLQALQDRLTAARGARKAFNEEQPPESVVGH
jgi:hypothetical protein